MTESTATGIVNIWAERRESAERSQRERLADLHYNGVHVECKPTSKRVGRGTAGACPHAGQVERSHGHDFAGPLVCGCPELAS